MYSVCNQRMVPRTCVRPGSLSRRTCSPWGTRRASTPAQGRGPDTTNVKTLPCLKVAGSRPDGKGRPPHDADGPASYNGQLFLAVAGALPPLKRRPPWPTPSLSGGARAPVDPPGPPAPGPRKGTPPAPPDPPP